MNYARRVRCSLHFLLAAVAVTAAGLVVHQETHRRRLIAQIDRAGGVIEFDSAAKTVFPSKRVKKVEMPYAALSNLGMGELKAFPYLTQLRVSDLNYRLTPAMSDFGGTIDAVVFVSSRDGDFLTAYEGAQKDELVWRHPPGSRRPN